MHRVTFKGAERTIEARDGEILLLAAQRNSLHIDSSCGGNGSCHQCRVVVHEGTPMRQGKPAVPRHKRGDDPVYLACQCEVRGDMVVEAAPIHALGVQPGKGSLEGWYAGERAAPARILDPGSYTGGVYTVSAEGEFDAGEGFRSDDAPAGDAIRVGVDVDFATALQRGTEHVTTEPRLVLDFAGRIATSRGMQQASTNAFMGDVPHLPGAIDSVAWSPLKTRTIITTVRGAAPAGLSASGLMACVVALLQAGMCDTELRLSESRFTRNIGGARAALLVGPDDEAQSPFGEIYTSGREIAVSQSQLDVVRQAAAVLGEELAALADGHSETLFVTGDFGTYLPVEFVHALNIWRGPVEFVPHAAALGTARATAL
jgi:ferredoxin